MIVPDVLVEGAHIARDPPVAGSVERHFRERCKSAGYCGRGCVRRCCQLYSPGMGVNSVSFDDPDDGDLFVFSGDDLLTAHYCITA